MLIPTTVLADPRSSPSVVTSRPASPANGAEVYLQVGSGDTSILWHMRYDSAITDTYKWRFLGGAGLVATNNTSDSTSSATYVELNTGTPAVTLPGIGVYEFNFGCQVSGATNAFGLVNVKTNGSNPGNDDDGFTVKPEGTNAGVNSSRLMVRTVASISGSALAVLVYRTGTTSSFSQNWISVKPVRLA